MGIADWRNFMILKHSIIKQSLGLVDRIMELSLLKYKH